MTPPEPKVFAWPCRVYYEDTDAGGIVYYANYLKFLERARTEWLRALGCPHDTLQRQHDCQFVVTQLQLAYLAPARLDEALVVTLSLQQLGASQLVLAQQVQRDAVVLVQGQVILATLNGAGQVRRLPPALRALLLPHLSG